MKDKNKAVALLGLVVVGMAVELQSQRSMGEHSGNPRATAYFGAMSLYRAIALHCGKAAIAAESHYWEAVS